MLSGRFYHIYKCGRYTFLVNWWKITLNVYHGNTRVFFEKQCYIIMLSFSTIVYIKVPCYYLNSFQFSSVHNTYFSITWYGPLRRKSFIQTHQKPKPSNRDQTVFTSLAFIYTYTFTQTFRTESIHPPLCILS